MPKNSCIMQIWAEPEKSALPICNYSQILYQFLTFTQNLKRSHVFKLLKKLYGTAPFQILLSIPLTNSINLWLHLFWYSHNGFKHILSLSVQFLLH